MWFYWNETLRDIPIAIVDNSSSEWSRRFIRELDTTPEIMIARNCLSKEDAFRYSLAYEYYSGLLEVYWLIISDYSWYSGICSY